MSGSVSNTNDIRLSTLPRRADTSGVTILAYTSGGVPVGVDPVAVRATAGEIGAVTDAELTDALTTKQDISQRGLANGYAPLDATGRVPAVNLPANAGGGAVVTTLPPANLGPSALVGVSVDAARADHVHPYPSAEQIGAAPISHSHTIGAVLGLQIELDRKQNISARGQINGYAPLGSDGKIPSAHLPSGLSQAELDAKANASDVTNSLALKADLAYTDAQLALKANANDTRLVNAVQPGHLTVIETFTGAYTATQADVNKLKRCTATSNSTVTLGNLAVGTTIRFLQDNTGTITFVPASGVTIRSFGNLLVTAGQGANVIATVIEANRWNISGNLA